MAGRAEAVIFLATGDPSHNTTTPGDNSGWQFEGNFHDFLGVPIAPYYFITAEHIPILGPDILNFHGENYTAIEFQHIPGTDLRVWKVAPGKPFPTYAPISTGISDLGANVTLVGRGTQRGDAVVISDVLKGWKWGSGDGVQRWGRNTVANSSYTDSELGEFLYCFFNSPGISEECHLSAGDSGGGMFVLENGLWRLAGLHYGVDGPFQIPSTSGSFDAALFDYGGLKYYIGGGNFVLEPDVAEDVPCAFYSSRVSASLEWLRTHVGAEVDSLASESFSAWRTLYFTPAEILAPAKSGLLADSDSDGIANLLEFALNLDPTFNERAVMTPATGLRGLPVCRVENIAGTDRLTMEFVRQKTGSGGGLTYIAEYSSDLSDWQAVGAVSTTSLNPRWERVKITDSLSTNDTSKRFARLRVTMAE